MVSIRRTAFWAAAALLPVLALVSAKTVDITVSKKTTVEIPETLIGYMWEDINHSGDGGLYAELLQNRAFQAVTPGTADALNAWKSTTGTTLTVVNSTAGVSKALPNSLKVDVASSASGSVGFLNTGYWGIKVQQGWTYNGSFYAKSPTYTGPITVSLKSTMGTVYATAKIASISSSWTKYTFKFAPATSAPDVQNTFVVELDGAGAAGATAYFGLFTLFPPTFKGRENGMRIDLAEAMAATAPKVWRFPGGNNLEGATFDNRWKWNETIGPLENRPGRFGNWGYPNTDGLGLLEYLNWAEDLNATVILGVWDGIGIGSYSNFPGWPVVPQAQLQPYVDDAIAQIEFITGDPDTSTLGQFRASLGRRAPYKIGYIEVGNEDQFQEASYAAYRWPMFVDQLSARFPELQGKFIATSYPSLTLQPAYKYIDFHQYASPNWFTNATFMFDEYPRNGTKYFIGEYAVTSTNDTDYLGTIENGRLAYPTLQGAVAEAAFMTGNERNADVVFASAYAPTLQNINGYQWTPDLITFDAGKIVKSASYYVQQIFGTKVGTHVLATTPAQGATTTAPLFWAASLDARTNGVILKVANAGPDAITSTIAFADFHVQSGASVTSLTPVNGQWNVSNTLASPDVIVPHTAKLAVSKSTGFAYTFPPYSVAVFELKPTTKL